MKVLLINGSSHKNGCTFTALNEITNTLKEEGIDSEILFIGTEPLRDCTACGHCKNSDNKCVFNDDIVNSLIEKAKTCDGFVFASPVYYAHPSARLLTVMDRAFYAGGKYFANKPAASVVSARRAGTTASLDVINKHFLINNMPVIPSNYWNMVHGSNPSDVEKDLEGLQIMRTLAHNMAWILKCIEAGKNAGISINGREDKIKTNFIR